MSDPAIADGRRTVTPTPPLRRSGRWRIGRRRCGAVAGAFAGRDRAVCDGRSWLEQGKDVFFTHQNARTIAVQASPVIVAALGMTVIIIAGGIDLAAGTALALSATVLAWFLEQWILAGRRRARPPSAPAA